MSTTTKHIHAKNPLPVWQNQVVRGLNFAEKTKLSWISDIQRITLIKVQYRPIFIFRNFKELLHRGNSSKIWMFFSKERFSKQKKTDKDESFKYQY